MASPRITLLLLPLGVGAAAALGGALAHADGAAKTRSPIVDPGEPGGGGPSVPLAALAKGTNEGIGACPDGMIRVEGDYCPRVEQRCLRWIDPPGRFHEYRCAEYARPARCTAPRVHKRFCIDRVERSDPGTRMPLNVQSWTDSKNACERAGARVCQDSEWTFACEGEEMRPYPYGWARAADKCNADRTDLLLPGPGGKSRLRDERAPVGAHPACASPFGLLDMAGNVAEWVTVDGFAPGSMVVQKGNWWQPGKHACRDAQYGHDRFYKGTETGFRCCAD